VEPYQTKPWSTNSTDSVSGSRPGGGLLSVAREGQVLLALPVVLTHTHRRREVLQEQVDGAIGPPSATAVTASRCLVALGL
jgi:hypothetical protein